MGSIGINLTFAILGFASLQLGIKVAKKNKNLKRIEKIQEKYEGLFFITMGRNEVVLSGYTDNFKSSIMKTFKSIDDLEYFIKHEYKNDTRVILLED
ncbi:MULTISPECIES: hypothetical protein [Bacteria]|uniref:hypothetical protein n=1 Tax=Bacteria TaxID=2 RepID=UPI002E7AF710|nr:hypothetical protein [Cetobacterium somerae]WVJ03040.1 hypothetical protein VSU16_15020 [Cetobacterium somerae]